MLDYLSLEELKSSMKKLEKEEKRVAAGKKREYYFSADKVETSELFDFLSEQFKFAMKKLKEEKQNCWDFMNDEAELKKAGFYDRKENPKKVAAWAEKAYPKMNVELYEVQYEKEKVLEAMRNIKAN